MLTIWRHDRRWLLGGFVVASALMTWAISWVAGSHLWVPGEVGNETPIRVLGMLCALGLGAYAGCRDRLTGTESGALFQLSQPRAAFIARPLGSIVVLAAAVIVAYAASWSAVVYPEPPGVIHSPRDRTAWTLAELAPRLAVHAAALPACALGMLAGRVLSVGCDLRAWLAMLVVGAVVFDQAEAFLFPYAWDSLRAHGAQAAWPSFPSWGTPVHWGVYVGSQAVAAAPLLLAALAHVPRPPDLDRGASTRRQRVAVLPFLLAGVWLATSWAGSAYDGACGALFEQYPRITGTADGSVNLAQWNASESGKPQRVWWTIYDDEHRLTGLTVEGGTQARPLAMAGTMGTTAWSFWATERRLRRRYGTSWFAALRGSRWWQVRMTDRVDDASKSPSLQLLAAEPDGVLELRLSGQAHGTRWALHFADGSPVSTAHDLLRSESDGGRPWWLFFDATKGRLEAASVADLAEREPLAVQGPPPDAEGRMRSVRVERVWDHRRGGDVVSARFDDGWRAWSPAGWGPVMDKPAGATRPDHLWAHHLVLREGEDPLDHVVALLDLAGNRVFEHRYRPHTSDEKMAATGMQLAALGTPLVAALAARLWLPPREVLWQPLIASGNHDGLLFGVFGIGLVCALLAWLRMRRLEMPRSLRRFWVGSVLLGGPAVLLMNVLVVTRRAWRSDLASAPGGALPRPLRVPQTRLGHEMS